jgi:hypothetical protein
MTNAGSRTRGSLYSKSWILPLKIEGEKILVIALRANEQNRIRDPMSKKSFKFNLKKEYCLKSCDIVPLITRTNHSQHLPFVVCRQEFRKTAANIASILEREDLLSSVHNEISDYRQAVDCEQNIHTLGSNLRAGVTDFQS